jgi:hypothetical protein
MERGDRPELVSQNPLRRVIKIVFRRAWGPTGASSITDILIARGKLTCEDSRGRRKKSVSWLATLVPGYPIRPLR